MQMGETEPFISTLLRGLAETTNELEPHQVHMFYEAVGLMISSDSDPSRRNVWLVIPLRLIAQGPLAEIDKRGQFCNACYRQSFRLITRRMNETSCHRDLASAELQFLHDVNFANADALE